MAPNKKIPKSRATALATVALLEFELEDCLGTVRSCLTAAEHLTMSERQWLNYLEEQLGHWIDRLNRVDMFQPTLWDGHR